MAFWIYQPVLTFHAQSWSFGYYTSICSECPISWQIKFRSLSSFPTTSGTIISTRTSQSQGHRYYDFSTSFTPQKTVRIQSHNFTVTELPISINIQTRVHLLQPFRFNNLILTFSNAPFRIQVFDLIVLQLRNFQHSNSLRVPLSAPTDSSSPFRLCLFDFAFSTSYPSDSKYLISRCCHLAIYDPSSLFKVSYYINTSLVM